MKTINAKRIAAVAASLLMGLAFAGSGGVTWNSIPIINNQGQPVVQVVVGSTAAPSDGVVAANIAAVLGNLAFTSQNVTATVNGVSGLHCSVTTPACTLTNQQVWFNEKGFSGPSGSYVFTALIGSVFNGAILQNSPSNTKTLGSSSSYAYPETVPYAVSTSPASSPFTVPQSTSQTAGTPSTYPPFSASVTSATNGGGLSFSTFHSGYFDNVLPIGSSQVASLLSGWGTYSQSNYLWFTGIPVYDQRSGTSSFGSTPTSTPNLATFDVGGVYQVVFGKPIPEPYYSNGHNGVSGSGNAINNANIKFLGKNWTILNFTTPTASVSSNNAIWANGARLTLAASLTSQQTVYLGHNLTSGSFTVQLEDIGQPNSQAQSNADVEVFYNGTLTNNTQLSPGSTTRFTVANHNLFVYVNQTFAGLYQYQKWAKMKLYSNLLNVTSGSPLNTTNANGWNAYVLWTNGTTSAGIPNQIQSIVIINQTPVALIPGQSFLLVTPNMTTWKLNFVGDTLGTNFDPIQIATSTGSGWQYANQGSNPATKGLGNINNLTSQPVQLLTVTSQIPNAFTYAGQSSTSVQYDLTPYALNEVSNTVGLDSGQTSAPVNVLITSSFGDANVVNNANPLTVTVVGYSSNTASGTTQASFQFSGLQATLTNSGFVGALATTGIDAANILTSSQVFYNITNIYLSQPLPGITVNVIATSTVAGSNTLLISGANTLAQFVTTAQPQILFKNSAKPYYQLTSGAQATYNQPGQTAFQNGFSLSTMAPTPSASSKKYATFSINEYDVPLSTATGTNDIIQLAIYNSSVSGAQNYQFILNTSTTGTKNNATYVSSQGNSVNAPVGFITERGSKIASLSPSSVTINYAKTVDTLQYYVSQISSSSSNTTTTSSVGPVGVGQAVPGFSNLTVSKVNATCAFTTTSCTVTGTGNLSTKAVQTVTPVQLNTATTPLVVLDSNANQAATLILVGSKYVNSVSAQLFSQNPTFASSFGPSSVVVQPFGTNRILVAGYYANQTVTAGNEFINQLLQAAGTP